MGTVKPPRVSVILPTHNRASVLGRAIRSVLEQTMADLELIVVDDASTDATQAVVNGFDDPRLIYLRRTQRQGAAAARNAGVLASSADLLAFQDSDDEWSIDKLRLQLQALRTTTPAADLICGGYIIIPRTGRPSYQRPHPRMQRGDWQADNIYDFSFITPTWLLRKASFEALQGFDEQLPNLEDWEFVFRLFKQPGSRIIALDEPLVVKHGSADSINPVVDSRLVSLEHIVSQHADIWAQQPAVMAGLHDELARLHCRIGNMQAGRQHFKSALGYDARKAKRWLHWLAACTGASGYQLLQQLKAGK